MPSSQRSEFEPRVCEYENCRERVEDGNRFCGSDCEKYHQRRLSYLSSVKERSSINDGVVLSHACQHPRTAREYWFSLSHLGYDCSVEEVRLAFERLERQGLVGKRRRHLRFGGFDWEYCSLDDKDNDDDGEASR